MATSEIIHPDRFQAGDGADGADGFRRLGGYLGMSAEESTVTLYGEGGALTFQFVTEAIVRMVLAVGEGSKGVPELSTTIAISERRFPAPKIRTRETETGIVMETEALCVSVSRTLDVLELFYPDGSNVCMAHTISFDKQGVRCIGKLSDSARLLGLGETTGYLNKRGEKYVLWNTDVFDPHVPDTESLYQSIPFLLQFDQGEAYGLFIDNPGCIEVDMRTDPDAYRMTLQTGKLDAYFISGPHPKDVISRYTSLTGTIPLPPLWAIGYHQSRYSYKSQEEVLQVARTFREKQIPCDAIYLDIHYMDEYRVFSFDPDAFPSPRKLMKELKAIGMKAVPIVDPGVKKDPEYPVYREGVAGGFFCRKLEGELFIGRVWPGDSAFPDFTSTEASRWWGELHRYYTDLGISGIWNDMNEPSVFNESKTLDLDVVHHNDGKPMTHRALHNLYGLLMSRATYLGLKEAMSGERPFVLTRAGYAGIQRYATVWTGDNRSYWEHLSMAMTMTLNLGLSGIPFCGSDIGGFSHHTSGELLARWTQFGVFSPYCRNHSLNDTTYQEPWRFGAEIERICRTYIELRYRWLPYLYSLFRSSTQTGLPIVRPLLLEYPDDPQTYDLCDQFLFGEHVLVAPVYRPGATYRAVYVPEGTWYDYWTGHKVAGRQVVVANAPLDTLPLFVKAGTIIAETEPDGHTSERMWETLSLTVYAGASGEFESEIYEDDGRTFSFEQGVYNRMRIYAEETAGSFRFGYTYLVRGYETNRRLLRIAVRHLGFVPQTVPGLDACRDADSCREAEHGCWYWDESDGVLYLKLVQGQEEEFLISAERV